jgi:hypothetical protein
MDTTTDERAAAVLQTLRWVAGRAGMFDHEDWAELLADLEKWIATQGRLPWGCPVCQKQKCIEGCPMEPLRPGN